jgi:integrase
MISIGLRKPGPCRAPIPAAWQPLLHQYLVALRAAGRPETTVATRCAHLSRLARAIGVPPQNVTGESLLQWFAEQGQWKQETRRGYRNSITGFFAWATAEGLLSADPAHALPSIKPVAPAPTPAPDRVVTQALLVATARVMLMLQLAAEAGLRRCEVARVHTSDLLDGADGALLLVHGKGGKDRILPISDELAEALAAGPAVHTPGAPREGWLFPGDDGGHLSPRWVGRLCADALPGVWTMHKLRHRFATKAYRGSRNLRAVQTLLGHASVATTERYTAVDNSELREAMNAARELEPRMRSGARPA